MEKLDINDFFKTHELFQNMSAESLNHLIKSSYVKTYDVNQHLFFQGDEAEALYVILDGHISIENVAASGRSMVLTTLLSGHMIGELALFDGGKRSAGARVIRKAKVLIIQRNMFWNIIKSNPDAIMDMMKVVIKRLRQTNRQIEHVVTQSLKDRLIIYLLDFSKQTGAVMSMTQSELAERLSASREKVNMHLKQLETAGVLSLGRKRIEILNFAALEKLKSLAD